jgi:acetoin:2,6-dichlorophenolindophenol oxidoreductase subunit alpha
MPTREQMIGFYEMLNRCMMWEQGLLRMIEEGQVAGFFHAGRGQEAVPVGACAALRPDDYIMYAHRGVGYMIAKGVPIQKLYSDFLCNIDGTTRGLGAGIVHIAWPELGVLGQSGTLGGCFPIAAGAALSAKLRHTDQVCVNFFGDGTSNRGTFHESANAAAALRLPVVWLCENNGFAVSVRSSYSSATENIADRALGYGIPGIVVDGMDVVAVYEAVSEAVARARRGEGPSLIEAKTYRFRGHFEGDPEPYRTREEVEQWKKRDPIPNLARRLLTSGLATEDELAAIRAKVQQEVDEAAKAALACEMPSPDRLFQYVYA